LSFFFFKSNDKKTNRFVFYIIFFFSLFLVLSRCSWKQSNPSFYLSDEEVELEEISELSEDGEPVDSTPESVTEFKDVHHWNQSGLFPQSDLPLVVNKQVLAWMEYFTGRGRPIYQKWLNRKPYFEELYQKELEAHRLPKDLIYLSMIESGFNPRAYSRARASGPWQFMEATGNRYNLKVDHWIDERRDPEKSTVAAARHLRDLYQDFDDWYLAIAAYNAGAGKINRAIARHKTRDFWALASAQKPYLRAETRNYVPKLLAALIIGKHPERFGFETKVENEIDIQYSGFHSYNFDEVHLTDATDLRIIAQCADVDVAKIKGLNPEIRYWFTPPKKDNYQLRLPSGAKEKFLKEYGKIPPNKRLTFRRHVIHQGETVGHIARRYHTSVGSIVKLNNIQNVRRIRAGKVLFIPLPQHNADRIVAQKTPSKKQSHSPKGTRLVKVRIQDGDTLWALAQRYDVSVYAIKQWNQIRNSRRIFPGDVLRIYVKDA
jgi:membrane-bound lytic murein transglycosylase D